MRTLAAPVSSAFLTPCCNKMSEITGDSSRFVGLSVTFVSSLVTFIKNFLLDESHDEVRQFDIEFTTSSGIESKVIHLFR